MRTELTYVELKAGHSDNGPAWIGKAFFNRTGQTAYFNGQVFKKGQGLAGNFFDLQTGDEYWISGVKKDGSDRHWAGGGVIKIDESILEQYLELRGLTALPKGKYKIVVLDNQPAKQKSREIENLTRSEGFDDAIRFKKIPDLTDSELDELIEYYQGIDLTTIHKKARKEFIDKLNVLTETKEVRKRNTLAS